MLEISNSCMILCFFYENKQQNMKELNLNKWSWLMVFHFHSLWWKMEGQFSLSVFFYITGESGFCCPQSFQSTVHECTNSSSSTSREQLLNFKKGTRETVLPHWLRTLLQHHASFFQSEPWSSGVVVGVLVMLGKIWSCVTHAEKTGTCF